MGIYALNNPNADCIYGVTADGTESLYPNKAVAEAAGAGDLDDVHANFVTWFKWGFIQDVALLSVSILVGCCMFVSEGFANFLKAISGCGYFCSTIAFYITGLVFRCRQSGNFAAGDIQAIPGISEDQWIEVI